MTFRLIIFLLLISQFSIGQEIAFPGAEGFGKYTTGGRGGKVVIVSNLNDSGPGSLREAVLKKYPRIIVFSVAGTIELERPLDINYGNLTIAGQSAPGDGISLKNHPLKIKSDNVIIRYIRSRLGDEHKEQGDAISAAGNKSLIIDHCSFSWSTDECASIYDNEMTSVQFCLIAESLNNSIHEKGSHGFGGIWGGKKASFHHNLFAHHRSRNPRFNGARYHKKPDEEIVDFRNNVIYNWQENNTYGGEQGNYNIINNTYKAGPATRSKKDKILDPYDPYGRYFLEGNVLLDNSEVTKDNYQGINTNSTVIEQLKLIEPIKVELVTTQSATESYKIVLAEAGASFKRDAVDLRIVEEVRTGTASFGQNGIIDTPEDVGGYPKLKQVKSAKDTDQDGMPDRWEKKKGLNPVKNDAMEIGLLGHYTNIEVYLNELVENK